MARFSNEINFCEKSENDNIIKIMDHGTIGKSMIFYVMPLAKETLRDRIKRNLDDIFNELYCQNPSDRLYPVDVILDKVANLKTKGSD